ncbi:MULTISPECIES: DUF2062 domain-containing protein [unclassified Rhizobium]|jgi:uncharacterized protein (DUF2062 family)|uniref:DUF2062 domain-containing protein n=1 Tax=unclassified Rhizobium TaxID=2613769 RepID=UPI0006454FE5|nr:MULTISPECIES: DUF2062 domain-containing protein [unclassified Rhizobium]MBN8951064.1 DUF2062 domain-containing protein [Rhizobium tropici]OJY69180.1 MAG: hypothetical protein BGP09_11105 [Rhizobium sp. 60-20]
MLFRRRKPLTFKEKLREHLWPRKGFVRSFQYFGKRLVRLAASPHSVAAGFAAGIVVSWTPFIGVHFVMAIVIAYLVGGNVIASALGCLAAGNPITYPFIWALTWEIGHLILSRDSGGQGGSIDLPALWHKGDLSQIWDPVLKPMLIGGIPPAIVTGVIVYALTYYGVKTFKTRRKERLMERARERLALAESASSV